MGIFKGTALFASSGLSLFSFSTTTIGRTVLPGALSIPSHRGGPIEVMANLSVRNSNVANVMTFGILINGLETNAYVQWLSQAVANEWHAVAMLAIEGPLFAGSYDLELFAEQTAAGTMEFLACFLSYHDMGGPL